MAPSLARSDSTAGSTAARSASSPSIWPGRAVHASADHGTGPSVSASRAKAASWAVNVLVAGTARSSPAPRGITASAASASGEPGSLVTATPAAPAPRTVCSTSTISGVWPDWLTATAR